ncbi:YybH family protein [Bradyrhizobium sp. 2TAF24]|uniref:YybH family protein n=1 Tax=Bradyrhizobium sp. 2TAF24 TaxID=3233011 RepID=UPI003F8DFB51
MSDTPEPNDFTAFMTQREAAARAYVNGDAAPLDRLCTQAEPASFFGPAGGHRLGATAVTAAYRQGTALFSGAGETHLEILQQGASDTLAFWTGIQRATVRLHGKAEAVPMDLRVTEIFRREDGGWTLVHRHADMLTTEPPRVT